LEQALVEAAREPALKSVIEARLAAAAWGRDGARALDHARIALELAERLDDDALRAGALAMLGQYGAIGGDPDALALAERACELAARVGDSRLLRDSAGAKVEALLARRSIDAARSMLEREYRDWLDRDEVYLMDVLWWSSWVELWGGRWQLAADYAERACDLGLQYEVEWPYLYVPAAVVALYRGQLDSARVQAERILELAERQRIRRPGPVAVAGIAALWSGDAAGAVDRLSEADRRAGALGVGEPSSRWWNPDYVAALLEVVRIADAVRVVDVWEREAVRLDRAWALAEVTRCRGLIAAAEGDVERSVSLLERAVAEHAAVGDSFGRARALLALGIVRRRARQKRAAREPIGAALAVFEKLGAATWIEKARAELGSIGGRMRVDGLTAAQRRVAVLVAEGRTNREVAAALFLSERTVAGHLTRVYAKLGVRSRAELARRLSEERERR